MLNDVNGFHVNKEHIWDVIDSAVMEKLRKTMWAVERLRGYSR